MSENTLPGILHREPPSEHVSGPQRLPTPPTQAHDEHEKVSPRFYLEQVNEVTLKVTNGETARTPASHGQWGGYNTSKALAWIINVGITSPAWLVRKGDLASGPFTLSEAKKAALALVKGNPVNHRVYRVTDPVMHLNRLQAKLADEPVKVSPHSSEGGAG